MQPSSRRLAVLLFTDIVGSVDIKARLGTETYAALLARHRELFLKALEACSCGHSVQHTGDGFLVDFPAASQAVNTALLFQYLLATETWPTPQPLRVRVGIHQGEVLVEPTHEPGQKQLVGVAIDLAARVMGLALGGQILLTRSVFDDARQYVRRHPAPSGGQALPPIRWMAHGRYLFKGLDDDSVEVCEIGAEGIAPLAAPAEGPKARRAVAADEEDTLGWRPAVGLEIPGKPGWLIEKRLGEGGFGEVWLARHDRLDQQHVFKFCFDADRLRSFRREITLFRLLRDALGNRDDFVPLFGINLDQPPYYLESEYVMTGSLVQWAQAQGGLANVPLEKRLALVADVARSVAAAHSIGIIHKDIKPSNILVGQRPDGRPQIRLADFGIGELADRSRLQQLAITEIGFTEDVGPSTSWAGTRLYAAPEYLTGAPASARGDIYALGVLLYQMAIGNLSQPLAEGWQRGVGDEILQEDIARCVDVEPANRFADAQALATSLDQVDSRRRQRRLEQELARRAAARKHLFRLASAAAAVLALLAALGVVGYLRERGLREQAEQLALRERQARQEARQAEQLAEEERNRALATVGKVVFEIQNRLGSRVGMHSLRESLLQVALEETRRMKDSLGAGDRRAGRTGAYALTKLAEVFQVTGRTQEALTSLEQARAILEDLARQAPEQAQPVQDLVMIYGELSSIHAVLGHSGQALELAQKQLATAERLPPGASRERYVLAALSVVGDLHLRSGQPKKALEFYRRGLILRESAAATRPADAELQSNLATHYSRIGDACNEMGQTAQCEEHYLKSLRIADSLAGDANDLPAQRGKGIALSRLSDLALTLGRPAQAMEYLQPALKIFETIAQAQEGDTQAQNDYVICLGRLGWLHLKDGRSKEALETYQKAVDIRRRLAQREPGVAEIQRNYSNACMDLAYAYLRLDRTKEAMDLYRDALKTRQALADADPDSPRAQRDLSIGLSDMGDACLQTARNSEALDCFRKSWEIRKRLADAEPSNATAQRDLALAYNRLGDVHMALHDPAPAVEAYEQNLQMVRRLSQASPNNSEVRQDLAHALYRLGGLYFRVGEHDKALDHYRQAADIYRQIHQQAKDLESAHNLGVAMMKLGDVQLKTGKTDDALATFRGQLELAQTFASLRTNMTAMRDVSFAHGRLSQAYMSREAWEESLKHAMEALAIDEAMANANPESAQALTDLVSTLTSVGTLEARLDQAHRAAAHYRRAMDILEQMRKRSLLSEGQKDWQTMVESALTDAIRRLPTTRPATQPSTAPATGPARPSQPRHVPCRPASTMIADVCSNPRCATLMARHRVWQSPQPVQRSARTTGARKPLPSMGLPSSSTRVPTLMNSIAS